MKGIAHAIDRFCLNHPRFGIRNLMLYIAIGNALVLVFSFLDTTGLLAYYLSFNARAIFTQGEVWRLITFILIPPSLSMSMSGIFFAAIAIYFYYFIGSTLERQWGSPRFTLYYMFGVLLTILYGAALWLITGVSYSINAMYLNLSMFFSFATLWPDMRVMLFFFIPVKMKWLALVNAGFFLLNIFTTRFPINLLPLIAVLNYLLFCWEELRTITRRLAGRGRPGAIKFRWAARKVRKEQRKAEYSRRCAVCGRTDTGNTELSFRYCSRCAGYHCFCEDHINNHAHFTE